jgi:hypothetical protein
MKEFLNEKENLVNSVSVIANREPACLCCASSGPGSSAGTCSSTGSSSGASSGTCTRTRTGTGASAYTGTCG